MIELMRSRMARRMAMVTMIVVAATGLGACGDGDKAVERRLLNAITATRQEPFKFAYLDEDLLKVRLSVKGFVEDDYRYKARFSANETPLWDEVVSDDTVADMFLDPDGFLAFNYDVAQRSANAGLLFGDLSSPQAQELKAAFDQAIAAAPKTYAELVNIVPPAMVPAVKAIGERRWVVDPVGAPALTVVASDTRAQGQDPFFDALTTLDYAFKAVQASAFVKKWDADALEPVYKPKEDPFPKPPKGSGVTRYDLKEPALPSAANVSSGAVRQVQPPRDVHFRKMAIYVKDGRVIEVRESLDLQWKLKDLARNYQIEFPRDADAREQVVFAVGKINELARGASARPIRPRQMVLQLRAIGSDDIEVRLPTTNVVEASLAGLAPNRGKVTGGQRSGQPANANASVFSMAGSRTSPATATPATASGGATLSPDTTTTTTAVPGETTTTAGA